MYHHFVLKSDHAVAETGETQTRTIETDDVHELTNQIRGLAVDKPGEEVVVRITATERHE